MNTSLGKKLELARRESGLTQKQLGEKIGKKSITISRWEQNAYVPDTFLLQQIAQITKKPLSFFIKEMEGEDLKDELDSDFLCNYQHLLKILSNMDKEKIEALITLLQ